MAWPIECSHCGKVTHPENIVELIKHHLDDQGRILCGQCKKPGYIEKTFKLQEKDAPPWKPYLRAIIRPADYANAPDSTYQPFAFLVSYAPDKDPEDVWFCYYKDTRREPGGRLKMGHGPGGPPVFNAEEVVDLVAQMVRSGCLCADKVVDTIRAAERGQN